MLAGTELQLHLKVRVVSLSPRFYISIGYDLKKSVVVPVKLPGLHTTTNYNPMNISKFECQLTGFALTRLLCSEPARSFIDKESILYSAGYDLKSSVVVPIKGTGTTH